MTLRSLSDAAAPRRFWRLRVVRFLLIGAVNTVFGYSLFFALLRLGLEAKAALAVATIVGVAFNFATTGRIVFANSDASRIWRFILVYLIVYVVNAALLDAAARFGVAPAPAQALLLAPCVALSYFLNRTLVFAGQNA